MLNPLRRQMPPERVQHFSLHSKGIRLLSGGKSVINMCRIWHDPDIDNIHGVASDNNSSTTY